MSQFRMISPDNLPTPLAAVARRVHVAGPDGSGDTWAMLGYFAEAFLKTVALTLVAGLRRGAPSLADKEEYALVRADGLGEWETSIFRCTNHAQSGYIDADLQPLVEWIVAPRRGSDWARLAAGSFSRILQLLDLPDTEAPKKLTVRHLLTQSIRIRNKTRAHGAVGPEFWSAANPLYADALTMLAEECPACRWFWYHVSVRPSKDNVRAILLKGLTPEHVPAAAATLLLPDQDGLHFKPHDRARLYHLGDLFASDRECTWFSYANGGFSAQGVAELLDYGSGRHIRRELVRYLQAPAPLPRSSTEGLPGLDIFSNAFGNLPPRPNGYVNRPAIEDELYRRLRDRNHPIITLHGRGGIGKTSLALNAVHNLVAGDRPPFDHVLWLSARDLDLRPAGPVEVRRRVTDLQTIARLTGHILDSTLDLDSFAQALQDPSHVKSSGILFVFDNFETLDDPTDVHRFLDTHTHLPNKVLLTSRERAFKGDFPIEVGGMELTESATLIRQEAMRLEVSGLVDADRVEDIHEYTDGHAYVMRVLLGEIARERRWIPLKSLVPRRSDLLNAVFERSFNKLDADAKWVFLLTASWRSIVSELALLVVLGERDLNAERAIDTCVRLSLIIRHELRDGSLCYSCPELARLFARKKRESDPDRLLLDEDLALLQEFGTMTQSALTSASVARIVDDFVKHCVQQAERSPADARTEKQDEILTRIAELEPSAWLGLARHRRLRGLRAHLVQDAYRRAVEELPNDPRVWLERADFAHQAGDENVRLSSLLSAVELAPTDVDLIRETAYELTRYINAHLQEIPKGRRGVYLASLRERMVAVADHLDATGLSRLAWLFLLEDDKNNAWKFANEGLSLDATNRHCLGLVERLQGEVPN